MENKILIVDDNIVNQQIIAGILTQEECETVLAADGQEALIQARQHLPDLILLDIMLPIKNGFEVCTELKADPKTENIPIIFISSLGDSESIIRGLELGGADYVCSPFSRGEVLARVRAQLKIRTLTTGLMKANKALVEKQKRLDHDLTIAAFIQTRFLPDKRLKTDMFDTYWRYSPCQQVGGDIFNLFQLDENHWAFYILDVSGHGVPAAMLSISLSQILRPTDTLRKQSKVEGSGYRVEEPCEVLKRLDREYPIERFDKHFTICYMVLDTRTRTLSYSSAGHPPPILLRAAGQTELLDERGTVIGLGGVLPFDQGSCVLCPGDRLFLYTDGIAELANESGEYYGEERLYQALERMRGLPLQQIADNVFDEAVSFGGNCPPDDDITLVGIDLL
jgi:sigma-B regulation protein RsbU (phosphoserine phosphatase)